MNKSAWEWLSIEPTQDIKEIKSAYAKQVKLYHLEDKPEKFKELQKAYKTALKLAKSQKEQTVSTEDYNFFEEKELKETPNFDKEKEPKETKNSDKENRKEYQFDFKEIEKSNLKYKFFNEFELLSMFSGTCNNLETWKYFLEKKEYQLLYQNTDILWQIYKKICSIYGYKRETIIFFENWLTQKGMSSFSRERKWKKKKSRYVNMSIKTLGPSNTQIELENIIDANTYSVPEYTETYLLYAKEQYNRIYKDYNFCRYANVCWRIFLIIFVILIITALWVNVK